jgi:AcrR family transcriptional regulator
MPIPKEGGPVMPRAARSLEEVEEVKEKIIEHAIELMAKHGFQGFSMTKLAAPLGIAAKTIYNYFQCKDELYLRIITKGFDDVYGGARECYKNHERPQDRLEAMVRAFIDFGIQYTNVYNLMYTWHVPNYGHYIGTPMEPAARLGLEAGLRLSGLFMKTIQECGTSDHPISDDEARFYMVWIWSQMHGFIAGYNNTFLDYMHENPIALKDRIAGLIMESFQREARASAKS